MLRLVRVSKLFSDRVLFEGVSVAIAPGARIGVVGPNGSGKSTLLRILAGEVIPDSGARQASGGISVHLVSFEDVAGPPESGGERMRRRLAEALRTGAEVLLLDEPTRNLDERGLDWLETALARFPAAYVVVSHDREFLDRVTTRTLVLDPVSRGARDYAGNYSLAARERAQEAQRLAREHREQARAARRLAADISAVRQQARDFERISVNDFYRGKAKKVAAQAKGRETRLSRLEREAERTRTPRELAHMRLGFGARDLHHTVLVEAHDLSIVRGEKAVLWGVSLVVRAGDRLAIAGPNGAGKTSLLETLLGRIPPASGTLRRRDGLRVGYLPQILEVPDGDPSVIDHVRAAVPAGGDGQGEGTIRTFLHRFLFERDDVYKRLSALSGGERSRAELARLMLLQPDLLVLDEPTNHLDPDTCERLEEALADFRGALLVVTHDRRFLSRIALAERLDLARRQRR